MPLSILNNRNNVCPHCRTRLVPEEQLLGDDTVSGKTHPVSAKKRMLNDGELFDKYRIIRLLGRGGMAEVYLAEHLLLKQQCALKLMQRSMETEDQIFAKRFIREAKLTHQFTHPNIVKVFDAGSDFKTGYLFLAMEYIEGKTLLDLSREKKLTEMDLLSVLSAMTSALKALNEARVVHRDIKPSNIMQDSNGVWKLMDLGIAKSDARTAGEMTLTMERTTIGTPGYASPEQCRSAHTVDTRSDIYSLGATLYHVASGTIPFDGDTPVEIILKVMQQAPEPLRNLRPDLSHNMLSLIEKMMEKRPENRPGSPDELLEILSGSQDDIFGRIKHAIITFGIRHLKNISPATLNSLLILPFIKIGKGLLNVLEGGSSLLKKLNLTAFSNWLISLIGKLIRWAVILAVVGFATVAVMYFIEKNSPERRRTMPTFKQYLLALIKQQKRPAGKIEEIPSEKKENKEIRVADPLKNCHPLMQYPGIAEERQSKMRRYADGTIVREFPLIDFASDDSWNIVADFDFNKNIPEGNFERSLIMDRILHLDKAPSQSAVFLKLPRSVYENSVTFSVNVCVNAQNRHFLMDTGPVKLLKVNDNLVFSFPGGFFVRTQLKIPADKWFNTTFSLDRRNRKFTAFSGNRLLGVWLLPEKGTVPLKEILFHEPQTKTVFSGKISNLTVYSCARNYTFRTGENTYQPISFTDVPPAPEKKRPAPEKKTVAAPPEKKTVTAAAPEEPEEKKETPQAAAAEAPAAPDNTGAGKTEKTKKAAQDIILPRVLPLDQSPLTLPSPNYYGGLRTVHIRMKEVSERRMKILSLPESKYRQEALDFIERQQNELQTQRQIQMRVSAPNQTYSASKTANFKHVTENFLKSLKPSGNWSQQDYRKSESLLFLLAGKVDPNIEVSYPHGGRKQITLVDAVSLGLLRPRAKFIKRLLWKNVDVNKAVENLPKEFLFFGKDDIDGSGSALFFTVADMKISKQLDRHYYSPEELYDEETACRFLLLSPRLNGIVNAMGQTPLHLAAARNHVKLTRQLILAGYTGVDVRDKQGFTPYQTALLRGNEQIIQLFEEFHFQTPFETKDRVQFEFSQYVKLGKMDKIAEKLAEGADPYQPWHNGLDALQNVCLQGKADLAACLLKNKVDPAKCKTAQPHSDPRHIAVLKGDAKILSLLLQYDSSQKDSGKSASMDDLTIFILSRIRYDKTPDQVIALLTAVIKHDKTWDANRPVAGKSLLYHCLSAYTKHQYTKRKVVEFLLQHKADPETKDIENIWLPSDIKRLLGKH